MFGMHRTISFPTSGVPGSWRRRRAEREFEAEVRVFAREVTREFEDACVYLKVGVKVEAAAGATFRTPRVTRVLLGPPVVLIVEMLPGQVVRDLAEPGHRLVQALGARGLRLERIAGPWARLVVLDPDPPPGHVVTTRRGPRRVPGCTRSRRLAHSTG